MNASQSTQPRRLRAGISLLEVLISIGILSIGLLATLALIPAGRYYMKRAAVDDRAAAVIPSAFATMSTQGMLRVDHSSWQPFVRNWTQPDDALSRSLTPWTISSTTSETIIERWPQPPAASSVISGSVPPPPPGNTVSVSLTQSTDGSTIGTSPTVNQMTGAWTHTLNPNPLYAPVMQIHESGPNVGEINGTPYLTYTFTATYNNGSGGDVPTSANPASIQQHGARRKRDDRRGRARAAYEVAAGVDLRNESAATATPLTDFATFAALQPAPANRIWRTIRTTVASAEVSRWNTGLREGNYSQEIQFDDASNAAGRPQPPSMPPSPANQDDPNDHGDTWITGPNVETDVDWYRFDVRRQDLINITWSDQSNSLEPNAFPLYLNTTDPDATPLTPVPAMSTARSMTYFINADGFAVTRAAMSSSLVNRRAVYSVTFTRYRTGDRAVVIDPLTATRLDRTLPPQAARRMAFAAFQQLYTPALTAQPVFIPRLNREHFAQQLESGTVDVAVALSDLVFQGQDSIAVDPPPDEDSAPSPLFDLSVPPSPTDLPSPVRRRSEGRGSWAVMLQPTSPGPVSWNWAPGGSFTASVMVFENRPLPAIEASPGLSGEYAFDAVWDDLDGMITVPIPQEAGLVDEDIRPLFKAGHWVMLAPKTISDATAATQTFDWVQIQTAVLEGAASGETVVKILPAQEPADGILNVGLRQYANPGSPSQSKLVVVAYEGVVAVVSKTVQLQP